MPMYPNEERWAILFSFFRWTRLSQEEKVSYSLITFLFSLSLSLFLFLFIFNLFLIFNF